MDQELPRCYLMDTSCQQYHGSVCAEYIGSNYIYISQGLGHNYIETSAISSRTTSVSPITRWRGSTHSSRSR